MRNDEHFICHVARHGARDESLLVEIFEETFQPFFLVAANLRKHLPVNMKRRAVIGVAAYKGGLLPIFSGDVLFRSRPYTGRMRDYCMVIRRPGQYFGLTLSHVQRDLRFPIENRVTDHQVDPDFAEYTLGGFMYKGDFLAVLDIDKLVEDEELSNASAGKTSSIRRKGNE